MSAFQIKNGACYVLYAFEVGQSIDLDLCDRLITETKERTTIKRNRKAPTYFDYHPAPLRVTHQSKAITFGNYSTNPVVESTLYDFGAVSVVYSIPIQGPFDQLLGLSYDLFDNELLLADAHERVAHLVSTISSAISKAQLANFYEDYRIFDVESFTEPLDFEQFLMEQRHLISQILEAEPEPMSDSSVSETLSCRIAYGPDDLTVIDWNSAVLMGGSADDVRAVLEFANVELLEMRFLDQQLDNALDEAYRAITKERSSGIAKLHRIARLQVDGASLYEGVNNALKLLGDQYLARVYSLVSTRFHLPEWDSSIIRKLNALDSIYRKLSDHSAQRRMEVLEWIIILLIAVSIALPFFGAFH